MIPYLIHVALILAVCFSFYRSLLHRETFHSLNRYILITCLTMSFLWPLLPIPSQLSLRKTEVYTNLTQRGQKLLNNKLFEVETHTEQSHLRGSNSIAGNSVQADEPGIFNTRIDIEKIIFWLFIIYWLGVAVFGLNLIIQLASTIYHAYAKPVIIDGPYRIVEITADKAPSSFMNSIFINPEKYDWDTYNQILIHEKIHVRQLHSLDILIGEIAIVFQWFNPFIWLYRKAIENNLEYLTDDLVLADKMADKKSYQLSLLKVSTPNYSLRISTNYNQSLLKKRIMMMNAKKSNLHILWKYIMLCPVFIMLAAIFNQPAVSNTVYKGSEDYSNNKINIMMLPSQSNIPNDMEGQWVATVNSEMVKIDLKNSSADHRISNSATFLRKEISSFPIDKKSDFHIKRDAGTIFFNGQFDSVQGNGSYKFVGNQVFKSTLKGSGITDIEESDLFKYLILNVKLDFLKELQSLGYNNLSKDQLASLIVLHIDYAYLSFLSRAGFKHIPLQVLVSAKVIGVDSAYIKEIVNAGYNNLDLTQIINLKMHGVAAAYLAKLSGSGSYGKTNSPSSGKPTPQEIITSKIISQDTVHNFNVAGNIAIDDQKFQKIPLPLAFIKSYENIGFKNLSQNELYSLRTLNITPEYIQAIKNCGFNDITVANLTSLKILNITPEYIKSFQESEHKNVTIKELLSFKIHNVTAKI